MSRDYQEEHDKAFDEIYEFLNFANPEVLPKKKNALGLSELVELVLDLTANNMTYTSILQIAYENALPPENFDSFFEEAAELLNALDESEGTIDEDTLTNLVEKYKSK